MNGKKRHFKVCKRCDNCQDTGVRVVTSLSGKDLKQSIVPLDDSVVKKIFNDCCDKCVFTIDELSLEDLRGAKKVFQSVEID